MENAFDPGRCRFETKLHAVLRRETPGSGDIAAMLADAAAEDRDRTTEGLRRMVARLEAAKTAFDAAAGGRLDKSGRAWSSVAQAAYARSRNDADAATSAGADMPDVAVLAPSPVFYALAGRGVIALTLGPSDLHRIAFGRSPSAAPIVHGTVLAPAGRRPELQIEADLLAVAGADRKLIEKAVEILLGEPWRHALCILLDRCSETSIYAALAAEHRATAALRASAAKSDRERSE